MAGEAGGGGGSGGGDEVSSPKSRVKFLCSYGGKILPRPADGLLKYVGGETRVIALSRAVTFSELMKKLGALFDGDMVLKYQLVSEDLDALVSVRSVEDLKHMLDEYDRQETEGSARLRTFLFPSKPIMIDNQSAAAEPHQLEQRYIDAINGIIRSSSKDSKPPSSGIPTPVIATSPSISMSSACSSPKSASPEHHHSAVEISTRFSPAFSPPTIPMHKVHSSPSICSSLNLQPSPGAGGGGHAHRHHYLYNLGSHYLHGYQASSRSPHHRAGGPGPPLCPSNHYNSNVYSNSSRHQRPSGGGEGYCSKCGFYDENRVERVESVTLSRSHRRLCWD